MPPDWRAAGAALAPLDDVAVVLLIGESVVALAAAARGAAGAVPASRRVAVFDLAGAFGSADADGLVRAFREGRSLNALARPLEDGSVERFVVAKGPGTLDPELTGDARWLRLVEGFRATGALLVLALPMDFASARPLMALADRAVRLAEVDGVAALVPIAGIYQPEGAPFAPAPPEPPAAPAVAPEEAIPDAALTAPPHAMTPEPTAADDPAPEPPRSSAPEVLPSSDEPPAAADVAVQDDADDASGSRAIPRTTLAGAGVKRIRITPVNPSQTVRITPVSSRVVRRNRRRALMAGIGVVVLAVVSLTGWYHWRAPALPGPRVTKNADSLAAMDAVPATAVDTVELPAVVNPEDSLRAAQWSVELMATNDRADANFRLAAQSTLKAGTLSPVRLGDDAAPWYKIVVGANVDRTAAELLRRALRQVGTIDADAGVVARVPFALRLDTDLAPSIAQARAAAYVGRGIAAYALLIDDTHATIYAGAFASPEQSVLLFAELRAAGLDPQLAFRVGRTY
jgi:hypothetical protein